MFRMKKGNGWLMWCVMAMLFVALPLQAAQKGPRVQRVYMFGFGASLIDSVACQTQVQAVDSAWLDYHDLLVDRSLYSIQLQFYIEKTEGVKTPICTVFFGKNERRVRKQWSKIKRRYEADSSIKLRQIDADRFSFKAEEYHPIIIGDGTEESAAAGGTSNDKADKKGKKGRKGQQK